VPASDDGAFGFGPQLLAATRQASNAASGRMAERGGDVDIESPCVLVRSVGFRASG